MKYYLLIFFLISMSSTAQNQFILFDVAFDYTKFDADNALPNKSHYYVVDNLINPARPTNWITPINYRDGKVHIKIEVLEKPKGSEPTKWTLCYIPNKGKGNFYGCTGTELYTEEGIYETEVNMHDFWENESIIWSDGVKQMDLVIKDDSGGKGHAHKRADHELFFPTKVRISMVQVPVGEVYDASILPDAAINSFSE